MRPEWALLAYSPFRIIESLFMWATDDMIRHYDRLGPVTLDEFKDLVRDRGICPNIPVFGEPARRGRQLLATDQTRTAVPHR